MSVTLTVPVMSAKGDFINTAWAKRRCVRPRQYVFCETNDKGLTSTVIFDLTPPNATLPNDIRGLIELICCEKYGNDVRKFEMYRDEVLFGLGNSMVMLNSR